MTPVNSHPCPACLPTATDGGRWCVPLRLPSTQAPKWSQRKGSRSQGAAGLHYPFWFFLTSISSGMSIPLGFVWGLLGPAPVA